ncbi:hypothetical protein [Reinekea sp. G2M2-21]|uniref:hypothetical protein n=1 Tax=Reinekea sp. G2M2-21 TaxID=2788942 RepID=UPI0018AB5318|nr:hypothetical protein [Reinekea sp. G2M2-21]
MLLLLVILSTALLICLIGFWSTRLYPAARPFRYNQAPDVHIPEARKTMLHNTLAAKHQLQDIIAGALSDAERIAALTEWTHQLWHPQSGRHAKSDNPITIISRAQKGERFARSDYSIVLAHAMMAVGIPTRVVRLRTRDCAWRPLASSYLGIEYFDQEHFKWVWLDGRYGIRLLQSGKPLNVLEIKEAYLQKQLMEVQPDYVDIDVEEYGNLLAPFLDIIVACPIGQSKHYALIPPQLNLLHNKWGFAERLYDISCHSVVSFYASHPIKQLTRPHKTQAIDIRTGRAVSNF